MIGKNRSCCKGGGLSRRDFVKAAGVIAGMPLPIMAGPFEDDNAYLKVIPADKKLDPAWVRSLTARGEKQVYRDPAALDHIGMPVGGLFAGTLYLSGDGRLWLWDIFNRDQEGIAPRAVKHQGKPLRTRNGANYIEPAEPKSPFLQGFSVEVAGKIRSLDRKGFAEVTFEGKYPIGRVTYRDPDCPVEIVLEAFSPFIPLNTDDSSLPATVMSFSLKNRGAAPVTVRVIGHMENPILLDSNGSGTRRNRVVRDKRMTSLECSALPPGPGAETVRPDVPFENFEKETYEGWTAEGEAFGSGPVRIKDIPGYQGDVGGKGARVVNSHASAPGGDVGEKDSRTGTLTSRPFKIVRKHISFLIGGGSHAKKTCLNLLVDGKVVLSATGKNSNVMHRSSFNVAKFEGKEAQLQLVDQVSGGWGNIGVDDIVFTDLVRRSGRIEERRDFGTMTLALLGGEEKDAATAARGKKVEQAEGSLDDSLVGEVGRTATLPPQADTEIAFLVAWHFPNFLSRAFKGQLLGHHYASRFESASAVARYVATDFDRLAGETRRWVDTWYDSTLPFWFLDRTMANTSILATTTCYRFKDGRFWAWEGIGCCPGTCTHVWQYAQAPGRLFPEIERITRERVDFGVAQHADGSVGHRSSARQSHAAVDGHCGRILGVLREHQMSPDDAFLRRVWPNVKRGVDYLIRFDANADGILEGAQANTLDAAWFGKISWISSMYLAALRAGAAMAEEMGEADFAKTCRKIADKGAQSILELHNGEYFIQIEDPAHAKAIGVGNGCHIDQVFGQSWAHAVGLGPLFDREKCLGALRSLWKYNFAPDIGAFRRVFKAGRWYAAAGDAGLVMCTWPKGGKREGWEKHWQYMYFNECMSGFEWQVASHMVWEGKDQPDLLTHGLAVSRAIHDRYDASLRNPYNEIECSDHYSRAMASYGVFQAACGFEVHGPKGIMTFAPRLASKRFKAAFTAPEGWGSFEQTSKSVTLQVAWGSLKLNTLILSPEGPVKTVRVNGEPATFAREGKQVRVNLPGKTISAGEQLLVELS